MKRVYYSVLCLAALAVAACNKEGVQTAGESLCANAYISSSATKTVYEIGNYGEKAGTKVSWSDAESFNAYYDGGASPVIFSKTAAGTSFTAEPVPEGVSVSTPFTALYGSAATLNPDGKIDIDFSKQNGELDNLAAYDVMTATSKLTDGMLSFAFHHNCAILRLKCVNYTEEEVKFVILDFAMAEVSKEFASTGFDQSLPMCIRLKLRLDKPVAKDSKEAKGVEEYRYVMVPAMNYCNSMNESPSPSDYSGFHRVITFYENKFIKAGKVYDVLCEYGFKGGIVEAD